jgi:hypothetical protein
MAEQEAAKELGEEERAVKDAETDFDDGEEKEKKSMTPWEQHAGVISIPRFDYNAPSSLLRHSHSGFLITCTISYFLCVFYSLSLSLSLYGMALGIYDSQSRAPK